MHLGDTALELLVINQHSRVLQRIPDRLVSKVVEVATTPIGWIQMSFNLEWTRKRLLNPPREERANRIRGTLAPRG